MAVLDPTTNEIVLRVVYDGPPEAGKTTSLRALAGSLAQQVTTPEEDANGRTLWFDWMEYVGGRFEGSQIRCQIVSVPGQRSLAARRKWLLDGADVVVSVLDSSKVGLPPSLACLRELESELASTDPPVGMVVQANKRDVEDAVALDDIREACGKAIVESIAADGTGIREAFVYAVRLALDRVRELMLRGGLEVRAPLLQSADQLLDRLQKSVAATLFQDIIHAEDVARRRTALPSDGHVPRPPDASVPSGAIWPPVEGRAILYEIAQLELDPYELPNGDWVIGLGCGWRIVSQRDAVYASLDEGRAALIQWARLHATSADAISSRRCIVLADAGDGSWRMWQVVRIEPSLRDTMVRALDEPTAELVALRLWQGGKMLLDAAARVAQAPCDLPCTLDTVGTTDGAGVYIGLMPRTGGDGRRSSIVPSVLLRTELEPVIATARIGDRHLALQRVFERVPRPGADPDGVMATLVALCSSNR